MSYERGDSLRHQSDGSLWEVLRLLGGPNDDYRVECVEEGRGSELGRIDVWHREYLERSVVVEDGPGRKRATVTTTDRDTGAVLSEVHLGPESDYVVICGPEFEVAYEQWFSTGTTQITVKRKGGD